MDVNDHLRAERHQVRDLVVEVLTGAAEPGAVRGAINRMTLRQELVEPLARLGFF